MPVALVTVTPSKTNLGLANDKGEVRLRLSGDFGECCRVLGDGLPESRDSPFGQALIVSYVDGLELLREIFGAASGFGPKLVFDSFIDFARYSRALDVVGKRTLELFGWRKGPDASFQDLPALLGRAARRCMEEGTLTLTDLLLDPACLRSIDRLHTESLLMLEPSSEEEELEPEPPDADAPASSPRRRQPESTRNPPRTRPATDRSCPTCMSGCSRRFDSMTSPLEGS